MKKNIFTPNHTIAKIAKWVVPVCLLLVLTWSVMPKTPDELPSSLPQDAQEQSPPPLVLSPAPEGYTPTFAEPESKIEPTEKKDMNEDQPSKQEEQDTETANPEEEGQAVSSLPYPLLWPASGDWSRPFGMDYDETCKDYRFHNGTDMDLEEGSNIFCPLAGEVLSVEADALWGVVVTIGHEGNLKTRYAGLQPVVMQGDQLETGDIIGQISDCPPIEEAQPSHLHFEIWEDDTAVNPTDYLN